VSNVIGKDMSLMDDVKQMLERAKVLRVIKAIEGSGCVIVNPNYNPVKGMDNGLILRSADKEWLIDSTIQILQHLEREEGHNDSE
jgi:hypothetical protein